MGRTFRALRSSFFDRRPDRSTTLPSILVGHFLALAFFTYPRQLSSFDNKVAISGVKQYLIDSFSLARDLANVTFITSSWKFLGKFGGA